ncbi:hypothetical protein LIER_41734 [Lithospermum erythrorhizon]|uniref:DUF4283 domain-containing protein n=1 Tax=Lithospermum erythrorhizon TaxID=34254 RepID=A0AAV3RHM0_LITER
MEADIIRSLQSCKLTEEEEAVTKVNAEDLAAGVYECEASMYVKIHTTKNLNISIKGFSMGMPKAWNVREMKVERVNFNLFHLFFPSLEDMKRIILGSPWYFENNLLVMQRREIGKNLQDYTCNNPL